MSVENYLQNTDIYLKSKSQKDIYMIYIMIFSVIFIFSYLLFWNHAKAIFQEKNEQINQIVSYIDVDKTFLKLNPQSKIATLDKEIEKIKSNLKVYEKNNAYIKSKINTISALIYNDKTWGKYLHSISKNASKHNVKIIDFTNTYVKKDSNFAHILDIQLNITAKYEDTLRFINSLEQSDLVVDIHKIDIKVAQKLETALYISVWGIPYQ